MITPNRIIIGIGGRRFPGVTAALLRLMIRQSLPSMRKHVANRTSPTADLSPFVYALIAQDQAEAIRAGSQGIAYDLRSFWQPWGFNLESIRVPVRLWHGDAGTLAPVELACWMAERIPDCQAAFYPGEGHVQPMLRHTPEIVGTLMWHDKAVEGAG
jgi:pimeloyl-ACP methyl ester carboxylesterase